MTEEVMNRVRLYKSPESFEVLAEKDGFADALIEGEISALSSELMNNSCLRIYARVTSETDGSLATPLSEIRIDGDFRFSHTVKDIPTGGPYTIDFVAIDRGACCRILLTGDKVNHLFVGDLYLIAGQSNAAGRARGFAYDEPELGVSLYRGLERWDVASMPFADELDSNMFLRFAKHIRQKTGKPIGLIPAAACDSPLSRWLLCEDGDLYSRAVAAVGGRRIKAVLWYQGCRDAGDRVECERYLSRFDRMVGDMRRDFGSPSLPFFTFQLNRQRRKDTLEWLNKSYDGIREAQRRAAGQIDGVSVLPAIDALNMSDFIHNSQPSNLMLGDRLALSVLKRVYGIGLGADAPEISAAQLLSQDTVRIEFAGVSEFLSDLNAPLGDYPIVLEDSLGRVPLAAAEISGNAVELKAERKMAKPVYASCQTGTDPRIYLIDYGTGLPALCFSEYPVE